MKTCLVTGGAGFIGSALVRALVARPDCEVRVVDNLSTGHRANLEDVAERISFVEGDICDEVAVRGLCAGVDTVFHQAALPSVPRSLADPIASERANVEGTLRVLLAARDAGVRRFVFAGSSSVYGDAKTLPKCEDLVPAPRSPYAVTKLAGELYCGLFAREFGLGTVVLRYFNVFGPRQDPNSTYAAVIPRFIRAALGGQQPTVFGDGLQTRDFTFVDNVVNANLLAADADVPGGEVFNVACGTQVRLLDLWGAIATSLGTAIGPRFEPARAGDVLHSRADIGKARAMLKYEPLVGFVEGLRRTAEWYRAREV
jgi:UDP-glucose 4-epimerase